MLVVCNGMIRAGSTLQYNMVRSLVEREEAGTGEGYHEAKELARSPSISARWGNGDARHVIKCHDLHPQAAEMTAAGRMRICYIYRDIRDVAVSAKRKWKHEGDVLFRVLDGAVAVYHQLKPLQPVLWQKYEDVLRDPATAVREIADFLDLEPTEAVVAAVAHDCSLEQSRAITEGVRKESGLANKALFLARQRIPATLLNRLRKGVIGDVARKMGLSRAIQDNRTLLHPDHISDNSGAVGVWRTALEEDEIKALSERYGSWLVEAGYLS